MKRFPFLRLIVESFASGATGALVVSGVWLLVTGGLPSLLTTLLAGQAVTTAWSIGQAARFRRKWQTVLASYELPALGEGIDIPNRPPTPLDDEGEATR
ncbi:hypothetical protein ACFC08_18060 [Streptomyces sp. NPDC056112]|uniref:hypothetical protein n=1 Tax=Streptomyces sp. NPDC056112 TaxID=3345715 RepID=UPI0035DEFD2B